MDFPGVIAGLRAYGGSRPQHKRDGSGAVFLGMNVKAADGLHYAVFAFRAGAWTVAFDSGPGVGGGLMDVDTDGLLYADYFTTAGDGAPSRSAPVPGWVRPAPPSGGGLSARYAAALERLCAFLGL